jgi:thymidine phosphorylase
VSNGGRQVQATLFQIEGSTLLAVDEVGLSETAWASLRVAEGEAVTVVHAPSPESLASVRRRIYGNRLDATAFASIVKDVVAGRYTDVHLAAFLTASAACRSTKRRPSISRTPWSRWAND